MKRQVITVREIHVRPDRMRGLDEAKVRELAESIRDFGLLSPIGVCVRNNVEVEPGEFEDLVKVLIYGRHRLEALRLLGECMVEVNVHDADDPHVELMEIAENLHRLDLTKEQRDAHIRRYAEILADLREKVPHDAALSSAPQPQTGRGHKSVATEIAEQTGLSKDTVERVLNPERAEAERQKQRERREREKAARQSPDADTSVIADAKKTNEAIAFRDADDFANWLMARLDLAELPTLISWLEGTKPKQTIAALRRLSA
ncbi:ParB/RepB/Spo0J family partition protein [Pseudochelatococcus sp. B33]